MAPRRVNPKLLEAFRSASVEPVEPLDFETPGRVVEVPVPVEHFQRPAAPAPAQPKSRLQLIQEYLDANRQPIERPDVGPEVDVRGAAEADARAGMLDAFRRSGQAFLGRADRSPIGAFNANETQALGEKARRQQALMQWAEAKRKQAADEADIIARASVEPAKKDPELETRRLDLQQQSLERQSAKDAADEAFRRDKLEADAKKKDRPPAPKPVEAPDEVRFDDMTFRYTGPEGTSKDVKVAAAKKVREVSAAWGIATSALNGLESAMREFQKNPSMAGRGMLLSPALTAAGAVNAAIGQGAMSDAEKQAQFQALGINLSDPAQIESMLKSDPEGFVQRILGAKKIARAAVTAQARAYHYDPTDSGPEPMVNVKRKSDGKVLPLPKSKAETLDKAKYEVMP